MYETLPSERGLGIIFTAAENCSIPPLYSQIQMKNHQTGIIPARKDRKICLVRTTTFCEFLLLIRTDKIKIMYEQTWLRYTRTGGRLVRNTTALRIFLKMKLSNASLANF